MPINRISIGHTHKFYFLTPTIKNWYYIFDRHNRWKILSDSLIYCQKHKNLEIYSYVFMLNHIHLIIRSDDPIGFLRDFKRNTSIKLRENIKKHEANILRLFLDQNNNYNFWKKDNQPRILETDYFFRQKQNYIHNNPVVKEYVKKPEDWYWSSANPTSPLLVKNIM